MSTSESKVFHAKFYVKWKMIRHLIEDFETDDPSIAAKRAVEWGIQRIKDDIANGYTKGGLKVYYASDKR